MLTLILLGGLLGALSLSGCSNAQRSDEYESGENRIASRVLSGAAPRGWRVRIPVRDENETRRIVSTLAKSLGAHASSEVVVSEMAESDGRRVELTVSGEHHMFGLYESARDSVEVFAGIGNRGELPSRVIAQSEASRILQRVYLELLGSGLVSSDRVSLDDAELHLVQAAEGNRDEVLRTWVDEYAYFIPVKLGGIEVGTPTRRFGIWVNVHRGGRVRRIELLGVQMLSTSQGGTTAATEVLTPSSVSAAELDAFILAEVGTAKTEALGIRLLMPENSSDFDDEIFPHQLEQAIPQVIDPKTQSTINGKAFVVSVSLANPKPVLSLHPRRKGYGPNPTWGGKE